MAEERIIYIYSTSGHTLLTGGKYCRENIKVIPSLEDRDLDITENGLQYVTPLAGNAGLGRVSVNVQVPLPNYRKFTGRLETECKGYGEKAILLEDDIIMAHYDDPNLEIIVNFEPDNPQERSIIYTIAYNTTNTTNKMPWRSEIDAYQYTHRTYNGPDDYSDKYILFALNDNTESDQVGRLEIDDNGRLYCWSGSTTYAVRVGSYTIEIKW